MIFSVAIFFALARQQVNHCVRGARRDLFFGNVLRLQSNEERSLDGLAACHDGRLDGTRYASACDIPPSFSGPC